MRSLIVLAVLARSPFCAAASPLNIQALPADVSQYSAPALGQDLADQIATSISRGGSMTSSVQSVVASRPFDDLRPNDSVLQRAYDAVNAGGADAALQLVAAYEGASEYDRHWADYIRGLALIATQKLDEGLAELLKPYAVLSSSPSTRRAPEQFRLIGKCLKKIGWYYRNKSEFEKAFAYHSIEYTLFEQHGSFAELHDAAISLDNDAYNMKNPLLDEYWIRKSIESGTQISDPKGRYAAVGMSYNNLAATLSDLGRFEEAEPASMASLENYETYENLAGTGENRVLWAYYGLADLYLNWAKAIGPAGADRFTRLKEKAGVAIEQALTLALQQAASEDDMKTLRQERDAISSLQ